MFTMKVFNPVKKYLIIAKGVNLSGHSINQYCEYNRKDSQK